MGEPYLIVYIIIYFWRVYWILLASLLYTSDIFIVYFRRIYCIFLASLLYTSGVFSCTSGIFIVYFWYFYCILPAYLLYISGMFIVYFWYLLHVYMWRMNIFLNFWIYFSLGQHWIWLNIQIVKQDIINTILWAHFHILLHRCNVIRSSNSYIRQTHDNIYVSLSIYYIYDNYIYLKFIIFIWN